MSLPTDPKARKNLPIASGVLGYFPLAVAYVAFVSKVGNDQHNPGEPLHWARGKSTDHADCIVRHLIERGTVDTDGLRHSGKLAWRALANLQVELEAALADGAQPFEDQQPRVETRPAVAARAPAFPAVRPSLWDRVGCWLFRSFLFAF